MHIHTHAHTYTHALIHLYLLQAYKKQLLINWNMFKLINLTINQSTEFIYGRHLVTCKQ